MLTQRIDELSFAIIEALVTAGLREGRTLDFKRDPVGGRDEDKREFLADVSAFANTAGGDLLFGVEESGGEATAVPGIALDDPDAEIRRLDGILRAGLEPRLPAVELRWLPGSNGRGCFMVRVPRSFLAPHRVVFRDHAKFYGRNSAGKHPLDVTELRAAFLSADGLVQSIRRFRQERLGLIEAGEGALPLRPTATLVLHIVPLSAFGTASEITIDENRTLLAPLTSGSGFNTRHTLEGFASFVGREDMPESVSSYTLLFRSGIVEAVSAVGYGGEQGPMIPAPAVEAALLRFYPHYMESLGKLGLEPPFYLFLSLLGVRDHHLVGGQRFFGLPHTYRREVLLLPEIVVTDAALAADKVLRPTFDLLWNAFGYPRSFSFGADGRYVGERY